MKTNSAKLILLIKTKSDKDISINPEYLNDFFSSVFKQALLLPKGQKHTVKSTSSKHFLYLRSTTCDEILSNMLTILNSRSVVSNGIRPDIIKTNICYFAPQLTYIFNLSFSADIFPTLFNNSIVTPIYKGGDNLDPTNYWLISILTVFSKLLEKLYYNRLLKFVNEHLALHDYQFGFRTAKLNSTAIAHVFTGLINKINSNKHKVLALLYA